MSRNEVVGIAPPDVSDLMRGKLARFSQERLERFKGVRPRVTGRIFHDACHNSHACPVKRLISGTPPTPNRPDPDTEFGKIRDIHLATRLQSTLSEGEHYNAERFHTRRPRSRAPSQPRVRETSASLR